MPVSIEWDNEEKTILRYRFSGNWTWNEYRPELSKGRELMAAVAPRPVCIINDMRGVTKFPPNFISSAHNVIGTRPENTGLAIFVSNSTIFSTLYRILGQLMPSIPTDYILVSSEQEAYARLNKWFADNLPTDNEFLAP